MRTMFVSIATVALTLCMLQKVSVAACVPKVLLTLKFDEWPSDLDWYLIDDSGSTVGSNEELYDDDDDSYQTVTERVCLDEDECLFLILADWWGDGFDYNGWFTVEIDDKMITFENQTYYDDRFTMYFCTQYIANANDKNASNYNSLQISSRYYNFDLNISTSDNELIYYNGITENEQVLSSIDINTTLPLVNGCYNIEISSVYSLSSDYYVTNGFYEFSIGDTTIANHGSNTTFSFCTNNNQVSNYTSVESPSNNPKCDASDYSDYITNNTDFDAILGELANVTLVIQFEDSPEDTSWTLATISSSGKVTDILMEGDGLGYEDFGKERWSECVLKDSCFTFTIANEDGIGLFSSIESGWYQILVNGNSITLDKESFYGLSNSVYFCADIIETDSDIGNQLTIFTEYPNNNVKLQIENLTGDDLYGSTNVDLIYENDIHFDTTSYINSTNTVNFFVNDGCFIITFTSQTDEIGTEYYGDCAIWMNGEIAGYCSTYGETSTTVVCNDLNHISFCITPDYCSQFENVYITNHENTDINSQEMVAYSFHGLNNLENQTVLLNLACSGSYSCVNSTFIFAEAGQVFCKSVGSCSSMNNNGARGLSAECQAVNSCTNLVDLHFRYLTLLSTFILFLLFTFTFCAFAATFFCLVFAPKCLCIFWGFIHILFSFHFAVQFELFNYIGVITCCFVFVFVFILFCL